jgi:flagellar protein FliO/FliZ
MVPGVARTDGKSPAAARRPPTPSVGDHGVPLDPSLSLKALAALCAVVLLAFAALRALRAALGAAKPGGGRRLAVQEVLPLDPKRRLVLVRCDGRDLLLVTGGAGEVSLGWLPERGEAS